MIIDFIKKIFNKNKIERHQKNMEKEIVKKIREYKTTKKYNNMLNGVKYYSGEHDILKRERTVIGINGQLEVVKNLPNNRIVDNQYRKMVIQKVNYIVGKPITIHSDNENYVEELTKILNKKFNKTLKELTIDTLNCGIGWLFLGYNDEGEFFIKNIKATEILPEYEEDKLKNIIRFYDDKVEYYDKTGVYFYEVEDEKLKLIKKEPYILLDNDEYSWNDLPFISFKYNREEMPLINNVKSLQDGLNIIESNFQNQMEEDQRNTILVLVNYDGERLNEFRKNLAVYGAVKVRSDNGGQGDVRTLQIEVNPENYIVILDLFKKAIIENAMGFDAKSDKLNTAPNQLNIMSMYSDIDLDTNNLETEYQASFEKLIYYINNHLYNTGAGDFENEDYEIIFNRDILINESEAIDNVIKSQGILSRETLIAQHPWIDNVYDELERLKNDLNNFVGIDEE